MEDDGKELDGRTAGTDPALFKALAAAESSPMAFEPASAFSAGIVPSSSNAKRRFAEHQEGNAVTGASTSKPAGFDTRKRPKIGKAKAKPGLTWLGGHGGGGSPAAAPSSIDFESGDPVDPDFGGPWADDAAGHKVRGHLPGPRWCDAGRSAAWSPPCRSAVLGLPFMNMP